MQRETLKLYRGDDTQIGLAVSDHNGRPLALAGCTAEMHAVAGGETVLRLSSTLGGITLSDGLIVLDIAHRDTAEADWQRADYDLQITDARGRRRTILRGSVQLEADITRS